MAKGYTKEQLTKWQVEAFNKIHWQISNADVILAEDMFEDDQTFDFEALFYRLRDIIYDFEDTYMSAELPDTITPSDEAVEEINKKIKEGNKPVKNHSHTETLKTITIEDVGNWTIKGEKL